jgi:hypothetical protein
MDVSGCQENSLQVVEVVQAVHLSRTVQGGIWMDGSENRELMVFSIIMKVLFALSVHPFPSWTDVDNLGQNPKGR